MRKFQTFHQRFAQRRATTAFEYNGQTENKSFKGALACYTSLGLNSVAVMNRTVAQSKAFLLQMSCIIRLEVWSLRGGAVCKVSIQHSVRCTTLNKNYSKQFDLIFM